MGESNYLTLDNYIARNRGDWGGIERYGNSKGLKSTKIPFIAGDILYGKLRPYLNKHALVEFEGVSSTDIMVFRARGMLLNTLLDRYLGLSHVVEYANANSKGINLPRVSPQSMNNLSLPLPPLSEQKRISKKLDILLNKINEAKVLIEEARETFANRRASILAKVFQGELTKNWRKEHPNVEPAEKLLERIKAEKEKLVGNGKGRKKKEEIPPIEPPYELPEGWCWVRLNEISLLITSGSRGWAKYYSESGSVFLRSQNIKRGKILLQDVAYVSIGDKTEGIRTKLFENDIVISITGEPGKAARIPPYFPEAYVSQHVSLIRLYLSSIAPFITWFLQSTYAQGFFEEQQYGLSKPGLNLKQIGLCPIPIAPLEEQKLINNMLGEFFKKEEEIHLKTDLQESINLLQSQILLKSFRGELGTNNPEEESAFELLKEVLKEKAQCN